MTGKELIIYILQNNLEDEQVFKDGKFIGFITEDLAAVELNVGVATIRTWVEIKSLDGIKINNTTYILVNAKFNLLRNLKHQRKE